MITREIIIRAIRKCRKRIQNHAARLFEDVMRFLIWRSVVVHGDNNYGGSIGRGNPENTIRTTVCITFGIIHVALHRQTEFI